MANGFAGPPGKMTANRQPSFVKEPDYLNLGRQRAFITQGKQLKCDHDPQH